MKNLSVFVRASLRQDCRRILRLIVLAVEIGATRAHFVYYTDDSNTVHESQDCDIRLNRGAAGLTVLNTPLDAMVVFEKCDRMGFGLIDKRSFTTEKQMAVSCTECAS